MKPRRDLNRSRSFINLWCQVELHVAIVGILKLVLDRERRVSSKSQLHRAAQGRGLSEGDQIPQGKRRCHSLVDLQCDTLFRLLCLTGLEYHIACANVSLYAEANAILASLYLHRLPKLFQVPA